jgi:hypothetical protein
VTHQSHMAEAVFHPTVQALVRVFYKLHLGQQGCPPCQGPSLIHTGVWSSNRWWSLARCSRFFFQFWPFNKSYYRNDLTKTLFLVLALLVTPNIIVWFWTGSRQTSRRDSCPRRHWCHVNSYGPAMSFGTKNESCHADWRDPNMSRVTSLSMTHFGSKPACFLII